MQQTYRARALATGAWLRSFMDARRLVVADVARMADREPQTVRTWLCGARAIPADTMALLELRYPEMREAA